MSLYTVRRWEGPKHPDYDSGVAKLNRTGQVWEDEDGWVYYIVGAPAVIAYESDGKPFQFKHAIVVVTDDEDLSREWSLFETTHRPLESKHEFTRLF